VDFLASLNLRSVVAAVRTPVKQEKNEDRSSDMSDSDKEALVELDWQKLTAQ